MKLFRIDGSLIIDNPDIDNLKELVEYCVREGISLQYANMQGANMRYANMQGANIRGADMQGANIRSASMLGADMQGANMRGADMRSADMRNADMRYANMQGANMRNADFWYANMRSARFGILSFLRISICGDISDNLILELMRHDAEFVGEEKMSVWAKGGECPYKDMERDFLFCENPKLWKPGKPKLRGLDLFKAIAKELNIKHSL